MAGPWHNTHQYRQARAIVLATSRMCALCGHDGADTVDHIIAGSRGGHRQTVADYLLNLQPAHGVKGCPTCRVKCNQVKGDKPYQTIIKPFTTNDW